MRIHPKERSQGEDEEESAENRSGRRKINLLFQRTRIGIPAPRERGKGRRRAQKDFGGKGGWYEEEGVNVLEGLKMTL